MRRHPRGGTQIGLVGGDLQIKVVGATGIEPVTPSM